MENSPVRHVLLFRFRKDMNEDKYQAFITAFRGLTTKIDGITAFEHGLNNSPEGLTRGFTHVVQLTFASPQARDAYLPHPEHKRFGDVLGQMGIVDELLVIDYTPLA
jgi:hypothetical protein